MQIWSEGLQIRNEGLNFDTKKSHREVSFGKLDRHTLLGTFLYIVLNVVILLIYVCTYV